MEESTHPEHCTKPTLLVNGHVNKHKTQSDLYDAMKNKILNFILSGKRIWVRVSAGTWTTSSSALELGVRISTHSLTWRLL
jgi:hypothetical protein